jgi:hypothetical protein
MHTHSSTAECTAHQTNWCICALQQPTGAAATLVYLHSNTHNSSSSWTIDRPKATFAQVAGVALQTPVLLLAGVLSGR